MGEAKSVLLDETLVVAAGRDGLAVCQRDAGDVGREIRLARGERIADARPPDGVADDAQVAAEVEEQRRHGDSPLAQFFSGAVDGVAFGDGAEIEVGVRAAADAEGAQLASHVGIERVARFVRQLERGGVAGSDFV